MTTMTTMIIPESALAPEWRQNSSARATSSVDADSAKSRRRKNSQQPRSPVSAAARNDDDDDDADGAKVMRVDEAQVWWPTNGELKLMTTMKMDEVRFANRIVAVEDDAAGAVAAAKPTILESECE